MAISNSLTRFRRLLSLVVLLLLFGWTAPAFAQKPPLGEVARREQERRKTTKGSDKVLTNKDLPPSAQQPAQPSTPSAGAQPAAGAEQKPADAQKAAGQEGDKEKDEVYWKQRIMGAREVLRRNEVFRDALQTRINVLSADFVNRDDPAQRAKIGEDRQKALMEMERVTAEIAENKKQIEDIEEEARKAGVPPGWLR
jgi:hypothetical protein